MYKVLIHNGAQTIDLSAGKGLISGSIIEGVNEFSSFNFSLLPNSPGYDYIKPLLTKVEILDGNTQIYYGRVLTETPQMNTAGLCQKTVVCEDRMAYLCDSMQPYSTERQYSGDESRNGLQEFIDYLLDNHNSQVEDYKKIYRGEVTVITHESSEGVYKGLNYESTWEAFKEKIIDVFGGEARIRETDGKLYLDYKERLGTVRSTAVEVRKNMLSAQHTLNPENVISRLIPLGAKLTELVTDENGNVTKKETEERLTIASVNDGKIYLESNLALELYGILYKKVIYDDIHDEQILKNRAEKYLTEQNRALATYTANTLDLTYIGEATDHFNLFDWYPIVNKYIGINDTLEVIRKQIDIFKPYNPTLTFGEKSKSLSDIISSEILNTSHLSENISKAESAIFNGVNDVYSYVNTAASKAEANANQLFLELQNETVTKSQYDEFSEIIRNILQMDADGTTMIFQTIQNEITKIDNEQNSNYQNILKYIRFEDGNIILGERDNPIILTLENDKVSFKQNGYEVAYITNNKLYVTDGEFNNSLRVRNFVWRGRNNGNLSLMKAGD